VDAGRDKGEIGQGMDAGLSTGVEVCTLAVGNGVRGAVSIFDRKPSRSWQRVSISISWVLSLRLTSPKSSFNCEHSLQELVVVVIACSLHSALVPQSRDFDSHFGQTITTPSNSG